MIDFAQLKDEIIRQGNEAATEYCQELLTNIQRWFEQEVKVNISVFGNYLFADEADTVTFSFEKTETGYTISIDYSGMQKDWAIDYLLDVVWPNVQQAIGI